MTVAESNTQSVGAGRSVKMAFNPRPARAEVVPVGRIPRVARLMALAIKLNAMLTDGTVASQAELAAIGHVTRARLTQVLNLLHLAPDLQEALLHLPPVVRGRDPITEQALRPIAAEMLWSRQREAWTLFSSTSSVT